ncbi:MAG: type V CRISPR-associated protein Cas12a/Cpf1 [Acidaminococcaceae bacterium]|nr:type V CRISPR-associated protein Cas12a/Cpf1 [Acidaminococcaceae bacterium]
MAKFNEQFIGQYSLSKTLRFELKPIGKTAENIEANGFLEHDKQRADNYVLAKRLLDDYYRYYIEETLKDKKLDADLVQKAYSAYIGNNADECKKINEKLRKQVSNFFADKAKYGLDKYKELFSVKKNRETNKMEGILLSWVRNNDKYSQADKEKYEELIKYFNGFTTYFRGFQQNRDNMFSKEAEVTAISNRTINENMYRFFDNVKNFENIKEHYPDLYKNLSSVEKYFVPSAFCKILSQNAIDEYNKEVIGRTEEDINAKGVNSLINEYRQKQGIKPRDLHTMTVLYKQILSDRQTLFIETIKDNAEAIKLTKDNYQKLIDLTDKIKQLVKENITKDNLTTIYLREVELTTISNAIFGRWGVIHYALNYKLQQLKEKDAKLLKQKFENAVGVEDICSIVEEYKTADEEAADWKQKNIQELFVNYFNICPDFATDFAEITSDKVVDYKEVLDKMNAVVRFYKMFYLYNGTKKLDIQSKNEYFYNSFEPLYKEMQSISKDYDKIRNFATRKPNNKANRIHFNFDKSSLFQSIKTDFETKNAVFLKYNDVFYLGIINKRFKNEEIEDLKQSQGDTHLFSIDTQKPDFKNLARLFFRSKGASFSPSVEKYNLPIKGVIDIYDAGLYKTEYKKIDIDVFYQSLEKIIDYIKLGLSKHEDYKNFKFVWKDSNQYSDVNEFCSDVIASCYKVTETYTDYEKIMKLVEQDKLYLFQIYNKDFSDKKKQKGTDNLHTLYWKALFSQENMNKTEGAIIKLNGEAEIFHRFKADGTPVIHKKGSVLLNKISKNGETIPSKIYRRIFECLNGKIGKQDLNEEEREWYDKAVWKEAKYDIVKDKRYYSDNGKYFFHCPITINFRGKEISNKTIESFNRNYNCTINQFVADNPDIHIIGIDRGERHLLYYTVIDLAGNIKEQGSLNNISSDYVANNKLVSHKVNYHDLLDKREQERADAREAWGVVQNIKEIKSGYLSQVVHKLALLVEKYNAVIVLEKLNKGFKRSRLFREKQVYQNFEKALIQKFNYLVFKNRSYAENGSFAKGYQLTAPFTSFEDLEKCKQTGILYYVNPSYTSHICPKTGFVNYKNLNKWLNYINVKTAKKAMAKFDGFRFNNAKGYFEFVIDYDKFIKSAISLGKWTICTAGQERYSYDAKNQTTTKYDVTKELQNLLEKYNIAYEDGKDLLGKIKEIDEKGFYSALLYWLRLTMQLRYTVKGTGDEDDYILSPVADKNGNFFDSRKAQDNEPKNADANGAYHIALKGLQLIQNIDDGKLAKPEKNMENAKWFKFARERNS